MPNNKLLDDWEKDYRKKLETKKWTTLFSNPNLSSLEWKKIYYSYLLSDLWKGIREEALARANWKCERCSLKSSNLNVHYKTYIHIGGQELPQELEVLCFTCHQIADSKRDRKTDQRRKDAHYLARLNGYKNKHFEHNLDLEEEEIEINFILFLYRKYCRENDQGFDPNLDTDNDPDFIDFWNLVLDGVY